MQAIGNPDKLNSGCAVYIGSVMTMDDYKMIEPTPRLRQFVASLPTGMEDVLDIRYIIEDGFDVYGLRGTITQRVRVLCSILSVLWAMPVLLEMHSN